MFYYAGCGVVRTHLFGDDGGEHFHLHTEHGCHIACFILDGAMTTNDYISCQMVPYHTSSHLTMRHVLPHLLDCGVWSRPPHIFGEAGVSIPIYNRMYMKRMGVM